MRKKIVSILVIILFVLTIIVKIGASKNINNVTCTTESNKQQTMTEETDDVIEKTVTSDDNVPDISPLETAQSKDSQVNGKLKISINFKDRQEAITYLTNETGLPAEECASAYDIYMKIFE